MYIESPEYRIPTEAGTLVLTGLNARSNVEEDAITGLNWQEAWLELPDGKLKPIQDKSKIQDEVRNDVLNCLLARTYQRPMESRYEDVYMEDDYDPGYIRPRSEDENILDTDNDGDVDKTDVSNIASAIIANDLGRTFDDDYEDPDGEPDWKEDNRKWKEEERAREQERLAEREEEEDARWNAHMWAKEHPDEAAKADEFIKSRLG